MAKNTFKDSLDNTPHLMTPEAFIATAKFFEIEPNAEAIKLASLANSESDTANYNSDTNVGVIYIEGSLTSQTEWYQKYFGGTSYESIQEQFENLVENGAKTVVFWQNSGGGSAYRMMETGDYLRELADENDVEIISYTDGVNASASYGLSVIADTVIANPDSEVGSVGVVVRLRNINKAMKAAGVEDSYIHYGSQKIPYDKNGDWDKAFTDKIQANVDALGEKFTAYVAKYRDTSVEAIKSLEAATFNSDEALEKGLIDRVMTHEEFYTYLADYVQKEKEPKMFNLNKIKFNSEQEKVEMKELEEAQAELSAITVKLDAEVAAKAALEAEVATMKASLEENTKKLASFEEAAAKLEADKEALVKAQADAALAKRKEQLSAVLAADKVEDALNALADAPDALFTFALSGYAAAEKAKLQTPLFNEAGGEGAPVPEVDPVKAQAEYNKKRYNK